MDTAKIKDWHAHVYFDAASRDSAWALRERIEKSFDIEMGRFHEKPVDINDDACDALRYAVVALEASLDDNPWAQLAGQRVGGVA